MKSKEASVSSIKQNIVKILCDHNETVEIKDNEPTNKKTLLPGIKTNKNPQLRLLGKGKCK